MNRLAPAALALCLVIAACGSDAPASDSTPTSTLATTTTTTGSTSSTTSSSTTTTTGVTRPTVVPTTTGGNGSDAAVVEVFFAVGDGTDCSDVAAVTRPVAATDDPVTTAIQALIEGPTDSEAADGFGSVFGSVTASALRRAIAADGLLIIDLADIRAVAANASSSCGSASLIAQVTSTAFQFPQIDRVRLQIDGSCDVFAEWLQRECSEYHRDGSESPLALIDRAGGSGCVAGDELVDGWWFGQVVDASPEAVEFDLACWFTGRAAEEAAAADGEPSPPNGFYIRNLEDTTRTMTVAATTEVTAGAVDDPAVVVVTPYEDWEASQDATSQAVWLEVRAGTVIAIEVQYIP